MLLAAGLAGNGGAAAFDDWVVAVGTGDDSVKIVRLSTRLRQWERGAEAQNLRAGIHWELGIAAWSATRSTDDVGSLIDVSATPVFRVGHRFAGTVPYAEIGIGVHVLTDHSISGRELATPYHFGSLAGIGVRFGSGLRHDLGVRVQHLSNAGVESPNPGINFTLLEFGTRF